MCIALLWGWIWGLEVMLILIQRGSALGEPGAGSSVIPCAQQGCALQHPIVSSRARSHRKRHTQHEVGALPSG
jgi:hypothetical protein